MTDVVAPREHLEAEVEQLRATIAELSGEAERQETMVLTLLLDQLRDAADALPAVSRRWRNALLTLSYGIAMNLAVTTTIEECEVRLLGSATGCTGREPG